MGFQDFAGSVVVHAVGGFAGLIGAMFLGPRIGRYTSSGKSVPIPGHNLSMAALGVFILLVGWYGFNPGSQLTYSGALNAEATTYIALTTTIAAAAGAVVAMLVGWGMFGKPDLTMALNGVLGGLVAITANCDRVSQSRVADHRRRRRRCSWCSASCCSTSCGSTTRSVPGRCTACAASGAAWRPASSATCPTASIRSASSSPCS